MSRTADETGRTEVHAQQWYARRNGVVRGPFSRKTVSRYILLGRIHIDDELSQDRIDWQRAGQVAALVPSVMTPIANPVDNRAYLEAFALADERVGERRNVSCSGCGKCRGTERRVLPDRRKVQASPAEDLRWHRLRADARVAAGKVRYLVFALAAVLLLVLVVPASH